MKLLSNGGISAITNTRVISKDYISPIVGVLYASVVAHTPPIDRRGNRHLLNNERFYKLLATECNYMDRDTVFSFYMALVGVIGEELRRHKVARLPHLGDFALTMQRPRPAWVGQSHVVIGSREVLKFIPKERLRRYFAKRQGPPRYLEVLPARPIG